jgi:hypothetical protein
MVNSPADALMLIAPGCAHCPSVLEGLSRLIKDGKLGRLEVVNILLHPEVGQQLGTRSVPWCRIGPFELEGALSQAELAGWTEHAAAGSGLGEYYAHLLESQRPHRVAELIERRPDSFDELLGLLEDSETPMTVRIGIGVVLEDLHNNPLLLHALPVLIRLADSTAANVRADAAHYLGLTQAPEAAATLQKLLHDENPDVREIAAESIAQLATAD